MLILSILIMIVSVVIDQLTKYFAAAYLKPIDTHPLIPGFIELNYETNEGIAWGMLQGQRWIFIPLSIIAIGAVIFMLVYYRKKLSPLMYISLSMIAGGGIGNQIDRLVNGYVVDFLNFQFIDFPVFNAADCFVSVGCVLAVVCLLTFDRFLLTDTDNDKKSKSNDKKKTKESDGTAQ